MKVVFKDIVNNLLGSTTTDLPLKYGYLIELDNNLYRISRIVNKVNNPGRNHVSYISLECFNSSNIF